VGNDSRMARRQFLQLAAGCAAVQGGWARAAGAVAEPFRDPDAALDSRVADLIARLTVEEKATLLNHRGPTVERFGIRSDQWNQCLHGVSWDGGPTTLFPIPTGLAATWNSRLVHRVATAISDEARAIYNAWHDDRNFKGAKKGLIYRAPVINILRNPYWGRTGEAWSEDPFLCGRMAVAFVKGLQGDDPRYLKLASTLKHFAVNNVEEGRHTLSAAVSERMLHEYWLPHFRDAVVEGRARSVMASYNRINGVHNVYNRPLLTDILKKQWGFDGFIVSDLGGVRDKETVVKAVSAGCDFSDKEFMTFIPEAVRAGQISEARLNEALTRLLRVRFQLGEFDPPQRVPYRQIPMSVVCAPAHRRLSLEASRQSIVLLQNQNDLLPLDRTRVQKLAVIGPLANEFVAGDPSYIGAWKRRTVTVLQGIRDRTPGAEVVHVVGGEVAPAMPRKGVVPRPFDHAGELQKAAQAAGQADVAVVCVGTTLAIEKEGHDRKTLALPGNQQQLVEAVFAANPRTVVVLINAGSLTVPWIKAHVPAIVGAWWSGEEQGHALADVLFGEVNPAGRLPYTVYASESQVPPQDEYDVTKGFTYMYLKGAPLFAFGHGLSYTRFTYANLRIATAKIAASGKLTATVEVANTGARAGDEVVQLYTRAVAPRVPRPAKELRGFERLTLRPGEKKTVAFAVPAEKLAFYDEEQHGFVVEPGDYEILIGASSADIRAAGKATVVAPGG
jgi:beta-glucosidase